MEEDPTVFQYDELYDDMQERRKESKLSQKGLDRKPKYINKLLQTAERRKRENERRIERQVQKEREQEGEEFKDKESFVTSAYRKKLEEMKELEEQERREDYLESIGDVRKQGNLDGFYRHLYDQKVNFDDKIKEENEKGADKSEGKVEREEDEVRSKQKHRKYRKRPSSGSDEAEEEAKLEHLPSNIDADSDFSIDSSDSEEDGEDATKAKKEEKPKDTDKTDKTQSVEQKNEVEKEPDVKRKQVDEDREEVKPKKPKIDIWKKRTVGKVFEEALQRYFERKALREARL